MAQSPEDRRIAELEAELATVDRECDAYRHTLATLRAWMAEYPNDKYTGTWWLSELDRITAQVARA